MRIGNLRDAVELVVFDCDGVLVDSELLSMRGYQAVLADIGAEVPRDLWAKCVGLKQADIFALIERAIGQEVRPELRARLWPFTKALFEAELKPTPGVKEFLAKLKVRRCVASSSSLERIRLSLKLTELEAPFGEALFSSQFVAHGKPAPDLFLFAAEKMHVEPAKTLVIEDSAPGVRAAKAAGARVIGFAGGAHIGPNHDQRLFEAGAEYVAPKWTAVEDLLING